MALNALKHLDRFVKERDTFMNIRVLAVFMGLIASGLLAYLGFEWIYVGYGLNPWIAFPLALVFYYWPFHLLKREAEEIECRLADLLEEIDARDRDHSNDSLYL